MKLTPKEPFLLASQGLLYAMQGKRKEAEEMLSRIQREMQDTAYLYSEGFIRAALGDTDAAMDSLMKQAELHSWPFLVLTLPVFAQVRKHPRFKEFCRKVGIPDSPGAAP
jgi:hypothetical protein